MDEIRLDSSGMKKLTPYDDYWQRGTNMFNKKFELMLTRRAKAYSSSSSQTVSLSPAFSTQFILGFCAAAEDRKN